MVYEAFFFDFDGVLADSVEIKTKAFAQLFACHGQQIEAKVIAHHREHGGMTRIEKFKYYCSKFLCEESNDDRIRQLCRQFSSLVVEKVVSASEIPGSTQFLENVGRNLPCFVISATPDDELEKIIDRRGLGRFFKEILGASRTKKENLEFLLKKYRLDPQACVFFGDADSDYLAAKDCGVHFVGILPGSNASLLKIAPDIEWYRNFEEIVRF